MATTDRSRQPLVLVGLGVVALVVVLVLSLRSPPQMGPDEEVFTTVDALFTAVTAKQELLLADCERRLLEYRKLGKLPANAAKSLDRIIAKARSGRWEPAAEELYDFMRAQRRDGAGEPHHPKK